MTLNASGPISLGGATTGQSINLELGLSATAQASINSTEFRTLAGVASGQISISNFYGKSNASYFLAYMSSGYYQAAGALTDSTGAYTAFFGASGDEAYTVTISPSGSLVRRYYYAQKISTATVSGTTAYYAWANSGVTAGRMGITSINLATGAVNNSSYGQKTGGDSNIQAYSSAFDSSGNRFVGGYCPDATVISFNSSGTYLGQAEPFEWSESHVMGVGTDSSGNVYAGQLVTSGTFYVVKMTHSAGTFTSVWTSRVTGLGSASTSRYYNYLVVRGSYVYVVATGASTQGVLYKLNISDGSLVWGKQFTSSALIQMTSVSVDQNENVYAFGHGRLSGSANRRGFVVKFNSSGTEQFRRMMYSSVAADMSQSRSTVDDNANICFNLYNSSEAFMGKFPTDGSKTGTYSIGGASFTYEAIVSGFTVSSNSNMATYTTTQGSITGSGSTVSISGTTFSQAVTISTV